MSGPTPRQQAGYLRRLLRRGEIEVLDPGSGRALAVIVELQGDVIRLVPEPRSPELETEISADALRWAGVLARLRSLLSLAEAEDLVDLLQSEAGRGRRASSAS